MTTPSSIPRRRSRLGAQAPTHFAAIFRGGDDAYLQVVQLTDFDYTATSMSGTYLNSLKAASTENHEVYNVSGELMKPTHGSSWPQQEHM